MTTNNNLDALPQDEELPFGHPGRRSDDTPEGFELCREVVSRVVGKLKQG